MNYLKVITILLLIFICGCGKSEMNNSSVDLNKIISNYQDHKGYDEDQFPLGLFTKEYFKAEAEFAKSKLEELSYVNGADLDETDKISFELLKFVLQDKIDFYEFESYLNPLLSDEGFHNNLTYEVRPLANYKQTKEYLDKLNAIPEYVNQHLVNLKEGLERGVSQPRVIFNGYESSYNDHVVDNYEDSFYYSPFKSLPEGLTTSQKDSVLEAAKEVVQLKVLPQFKRIKEFFETEYLPTTRTTLGASDTPNGNAYYQNRINFYTTSTQYTPDDIHQIGLNEVARIKEQMEQIIKDLNFDGSFAEFLQFLRTDEQFYAKTPEQLLMIAISLAIIKSCSGVLA